MKAKLFLIITLIAFGLFSCDKEDLFEQPSIEVTGISLAELPGENADIEVTFLLTSNDKRDALITNVTYEVIVEGFVAEPENLTLNKTVTPDAPLELTLPLTLKTDEAVQLLKKLDAGNELQYSVPGTFNVDKTFIGVVDFPIDIEGTAPASLVSAK